MEKIVKTLIAADLFLSIAVIAIIVSLSSFMKMDNERDAQLRLASQVAAPAVPKKAAAAKVPKSAEIALSDENIDPRGLLVYTNEIVTLSIVNNGKEARSFKIGGLNFDLGLINPGETKKASLGSLPKEQANYEYISVAADGSRELTGALIVLVK